MHENERNHSLSENEMQNLFIRWACAGPYSRTSDTIQDSSQLHPSQNRVKEEGCTRQSTAFRVTFLATETLAHTSLERHCCSRRCPVKTDKLHHTPDSVSCAGGTEEFCVLSWEFKQMFCLIYVSIQSPISTFLHVPRHFRSHRIFVYIPILCDKNQIMAKFCPNDLHLQCLLLLITWISFPWGERKRVAEKKI